MKDGKIGESPLTWGLAIYEPVHVFRFKNIKLWELNVETLRETHLMGLLPLCLLTQDGKKHEVAEDIFDSLASKKELLALALTFASMIFEGEADQEWLKRRIGMLDDIIRETWFYQDIYQDMRELFAYTASLRGRNTAQCFGRDSIEHVQVDTCMNIPCV